MERKGGDERRSSEPVPAWADTAPAVLARLGVSAEQGLGTEQAAARLASHGPNVLRQTATKSLWSTLWDQVASPIPVLLLIAGLLALAFGEVPEASAIAAVLLVDAAIGTITERRALRSMEALRRLGQAEVVVRREGAARTVPAEELVPGDVLLLDAGDILAADCRLLDGSRLQVDESTLTGESLPVGKAAAPVPEETHVTERHCMLHKGTALTRGTAEAVVVATGMDTELGRISSLVEAAEGVTTPLERRLAELANRLIWLTAGIAVLVAGALLATGRGVLLAVETSIALAVATIPEGLPIVATVALARGMWRMARRNALVEDLAAVETLGSTTVLLTDKTGTLTENRMTVVAVELPGGTVAVEGAGLEPRGRFLRDGHALAAADDAELRALVRAGVLCNNAGLGEDGAVGDPTEVALLVLGEKAGLTRGEVSATFPEVAEVAFDPDSKRMATLHDHGDGAYAAVKGAPEAILPACAFVRREREAVALEPAERAAWEERVETHAGMGRRVLALAEGRAETAEGFAFEGLTLLGLVGLVDPPRASAGPALAALRAAGIRPVMVTGDHGATARSIATAVGLVDSPAEAEAASVDCRGLAPRPEWSPDDERALLRTSIFARATPAQKLDLIDLHQRAGEVVAMTGDGVNDAPALKKADIGVAMGLRGTQVAREAAAMVLRDDELGTIAVAVTEGRAILANIRKFVVYLLSCNVSEIFVVAVGSALPGPLPLLPLQILFLNLVTDVFPALALGVCEGSPSLATAQPREPSSALLEPRHWRRIFTAGAFLAASVLAAFLLALTWLDLPGPEATSVGFLTLATAQLWHVFSMRGAHSGPWRNEVTTNPWVWAALVLCLALLVAAVHWSPLSTALSLVDPGGRGWALALTASLAAPALAQLELLLRPRRTAAREGA